MNYQLLHGAMMDTCNDLYERKVRGYWEIVKILARNFRLFYCRSVFFLKEISFVFTPPELF